MGGSELQCKLALSFLKELCRVEKENFVISPLSLGMALAMLTAGLRGKTQTELLQLFGATDENELHSMYSTLLSEKNLPLKLANKYLATVNMRIHPKFESLLKSTYESEIESVNFARDSGEIETNVNAWVANKTNGMIPEILSKGSLNKDTILVLLNTVYFNGSWLPGEFEPVPGLMDFKMRCGTKVQRSFMEKTSRFIGFGCTETLRLARIPYLKTGFSMLVAIPTNEGEDIHDVINGMTTADLIIAMQSKTCTMSHRYPCTLLMPKFKIEYNFDSAKDVLEKLGVTEIFAPGVGDFGNLFTEREKGPFVDGIHHRAVIEVDEKGTTATGAAGMNLIPLCGGLPQPRVVVLDRPFLFFIMSTNDIVCFSGICTKP